MKAEFETGTEVMGGAIRRSSLSGRDRIGKYTVIRLLGKGGEGAVYLAQDEDLQRPVAVKQLCGFGERADMEKREADFLRRLRHPMLPVIYELLWDTGWYLVMEYIQGITLQDYIDANGCVREEQACIWMDQLLDVMEYLHTRKPPVIYRDLKPDNIMVCPDGHLRLVDFGAADIRNYGAKGCGVMAATPGYAAPEQFGRGGSLRVCGRTGESTGTGMERGIYADERSDIYALGKILYYMVTGTDPARPPYTSLPIQDYQPLLSDRLEKVIRRCIEEDPGRRYQTAGEVRKELRCCGKSRHRPLRRSFIRAVEKKVWLTEMRADTIE